MKKARIILGILCVISAVGCGYYVQKSRENIDTEGPKLEAASDTLEVSINATEDELTKDVVAEDKKDGNVSDSIIIENITKKVGGNENQFEITYVGFDKSSNSGRLKRNLVYTDYTKTHFALSQELRFPENQAVSLLDYITAEDCIDGDVSPFIIVDGEENLQQEPSAGIYDCTVSVTNSVGDTVQLPLQVEIYDDAAMTEYVANINWDTFLANIKAAGVPDELATQLETILTSAVESMTATDEDQDTSATDSSADGETEAADDAA